MSPNPAPLKQMSLVTDLKMYKLKCKYERMPYKQILNLWTTHTKSSSQLLNFSILTVFFIGGLQIMS